MKVLNDEELSKVLYRIEETGPGRRNWGRVGEHKKMLRVGVQGERNMKT